LRYHSSGVTRTLFGSIVVPQVVTGGESVERIFELESHVYFVVFVKPRVEADSNIQSQ